MASPFPLQTAFLGMVQDGARDGLPAGALWNCVDFIPRILGSPLRKRGGWMYASPTITGTYIDAICYAPFLAGEQNIAIASDGKVYPFTPDTLSATIGTAFAVNQNPVFHRSGIPTLGTVIIPAASGTTTPKSYDGVTFGDLGGTPPQGRFAGVWNDRTLLAHGTAGGVMYPNRLWFGPVGNAAAAWDLADAWQDFSLPVTGIGVLKTAIMCFHKKSTERLRGTTPPSATAVGDLVQDTAFSVGCIDARSIVSYNDTIIFADVRGVYQTDGAALKDLTAAGGMSGYWRRMLSHYTAGYTIAAGVYSDILMVSVMDGALFIDCLCYDFAQGFWFRMGNIPARSFTRQGSTFEEVYMALGNSGHVAALSSIVKPTALNVSDADGTAVEPYFETGLYRGFMRFHRRWVESLGLQDWKTLFLNYDMRSFSDDPTITVSFATDPGSTMYTDIARTLAATTAYTRVSRPLGFHGNGLMLKVAQSGASSDTRMSGFEAEYSPREASRLAQ